MLRSGVGAAHVGIDMLRQLFGDIPDTRASNKSIPVVDALMSFFAIFFLKFPSLLEFEESLRAAGSKIPSNLTRLFSVLKIPTDSQMRDIVDKIPSKYLSSLFKYIFSMVQRGNLLCEFEFTRKDGVPMYLMAIDGTEYFTSKKIHCPACMVKRHRDGSKSYYHQGLVAAIFHPDKKEVIPLAVEGIMKQDGSNKNDCELNAFKRLLERIRKEHPKLGLIVCGDALYATGSAVEFIRKHNMSYILNVKPKGHRKLSGHVREHERKKGYCDYGIHSEVIGEKVKKTIDCHYHYAKGVRLDNSPSSEGFRVNFLECTEVKKWTGKGDRKNG